MKITWDTITKILENNGFTVDKTESEAKNKTHVALETTTALGEPIELHFTAATPEEFINEFTEYVLQYDPIEHATQNIEYNKNANIEELTDDAYKFQDTLKQTEKELRHYNWNETDKYNDTLQRAIEETIEKINKLYQHTKETNEILNNLLENEEFKRIIRKNKLKKLKNNIVLTQSFMVILTRNLEVAKANFGHVKNETYKNRKEKP